MTINENLSFPDSLFFIPFIVLAVISILAPLGYGVLLFPSGAYDASALLRFPFLFVVSLFYGYFMQLVRTQKVLREQAEQKKGECRVAQHTFP